MVRRLTLFCLAAVLFAGGCSHYAEPAADTRQTAQLIGRNGAYIYRIDGEDVLTAQKVSAENGNRVRVTGGSHQLKVTVVGNHPATWTFLFDADAGHTYLIEPDTGSSLGLGVTDEATGRKVPVK